QFHISRSLKKFQKKQNYTVTINRDFAAVIQHCALHRGLDKVWITEEMRAAYINLHLKNHAHSVEVWQNDELVGGMYGVLIGALFCGESMFSLKPNASKVALWYFLDHFAHGGGQLFECQILTPHLASLGASLLARQDYFERVQVLQNKALPHALFLPQTITLS
ncbi:MAG: leucyl/phenylalanyl-tRNA--protein transferase, partial [Enterovibrio sp.]